MEKCMSECEIKMFIMKFAKSEKSNIILKFSLIKVDVETEQHTYSSFPAYDN